jgi:hypothetical protein
VEGMGFNCFLAEFRGYGMSTGMPALGKMLCDVEKIIRAIDQPPENLVLFGRSVGSIHAIHGISLFPRVAGLIIESGIADPLERLLLRVDPSELGVTLPEMEAAVAAELNHQEKLASYKGPSLIMHTRHDGLVDVSHGQRIYDWVGGPKTLKIFPQGNHNNIMFVNAREYFTLLQSFVSGLLKRELGQGSG